MNNETTIIKKISDLGVAAYLNMFSYKIIGKNGRDFFFEIPTNEENSFIKDSFEYENSQCKAFDDSLMSLKRRPNYVPKK